MVHQLRSVVIALTCVCACAHAHMGYWGGQSSLQPVAGLYVKPSHDGITGDLYVAASEDNGVNSQWVSEQPINFMQSYAQGQSAVPISYSSSLTTAKSPLEEVITAQKRAVITNPQVQYTYPVGADGKPAVLSYPYTMMAGAGTSAQYPEAAAAAYAGHPYSAFHYFYPYLMSAALANAMKELGVNEETTNAVATPAATPAASAWASSAYYPWQYMMDPTAWAQHAAAAAATTPAPAAPAQEAQTSNETANM